MDVRIGLQRKLSTEEFMLLTVELGKTLESLLKEKSPKEKESLRKEICPGCSGHWKD